MVWTPGARPDAENTGSGASASVPLGPAVSTVAGVPPSMDTVAIPQPLQRVPIQVTAVPVKAKVADAPGSFDARIVPPLKALIPYWVQVEGTVPEAKLAESSSYCPSRPTPGTATSCQVVPRTTRSWITELAG